MSIQTVDICDVDGCSALAAAKFEYVTVGVWDINQKKGRSEDGLHVWTSVGVDLCGEHEYKYRTSLPQIRLKQMGGITS